MSRVQTRSYPANGKADTFVHERKAGVSHHQFDKVKLLQLHSVFILCQFLHFRIKFSIITMPTDKANTRAVPVSAANETDDDTTTGAPTPVESLAEGTG